VRAEYRDVTLALEDRHWWYRGRRRIVRQVLESLPLARPALVLDAGCGGGANLAELERLGPVTGLEPSEVAAAAARRRSVGEIVEGSIETMPFEDAAFDLATALDVIEHVDDDGQAFRELRRVVKPDGFLLVTVPAYPRLWGPHDVVNGHRRRYVRRSLHEAAEPAGWRPLLTTHFNSILLPPAALLRILQRRRPTASSAVERSDLERTPRWMDGVLELPLRAEARALGLGARIPFGLSLLSLFAAGDSALPDQGRDDRLF
jgi:SAM-dependent methyltransferase